MSEHVNRLSPLPPDAGVARRRVAGAEDVEPRLRIVDARNPRPARRRAARPRGSATCRARDRPASSARCRTSTAACRFPGSNDCRNPGMSRSLPVPTSTWLSTTIGAMRREVLLVEVGDLDVPAFLAGASRRATPDSCPASRRTGSCARWPRRDCRCACRPCLPEVVPQFAAVARIERPHVVGRRDVEHAVHLQDRALDARRRRRPRTRRCPHRR